MSETTNTTEVQFFLDWEGLQKYDELIKGHINNVISPVSGNAQTAVNFITAFCDGVSQENPVPTLQTIANHIGNSEALHVTTGEKAAWNGAVTQLESFQDTVNRLNSSVEDLTQDLNSHIGESEALHITAEERRSWTQAAADINAFLTGVDNKDQLIENLKEIQNYITDDIKDFNDLNTRVEVIEADYVKASNAIPIASIEKLFDSPATTE